MDIGLVESINKWLAKVGGINPHSLPIFQLVFSKNQTEIRLGTFRDFTPAGLFVREVTEVRRVPKYDFLAAPCWVLERWIPPEFVQNSDELVTWRSGTYEPFWCFLDKKERPIDPSPSAIQFIIHQTFNPKHITPEQRRGMVEMEFESEVSQIAEMIDIDHLKWDVGYTKEIAHVDVIQ